MAFKSKQQKQRLTRSEVLALPADAVLSEHEVSALTNLSVMSFRRYRLCGDGPTYLRIGKAKVGYIKSDVLDWLKARRYRDRGHEMDEAAKRQHAA
jgi:predicted DNA-binding transcriptional regulator AlpA